MTEVTCLPEVCADDGTYAYDPLMQVLFVTELDDPNDIAGSTLDDADDLTGDYALTDLIGWEVTSEVIVNPPWGLFLAQRPGHTRVDRAEMLFAADRVGQDIRTLLARGVTGWVLLFPAGLDGPYNAYPSRVAAVHHLTGLRTGQGAQIRVVWTVIAAPVDNIGIGS